MQYRISSRLLANFYNSYNKNTRLHPYFSNLVCEMRALGVDRLNVGVFGGVGCGKSALLNTMYAVITSQYVEFAQERKLGKR